MFSVISVFRRRILKLIEDDNNNTLPNPKKQNAVKQSRSHGSLIENNANKFYMSDDPEVLAKERKKLVKRTKSFWKFGKNTSDNEILEGMALWRHRDLVDVEDERTREKRILNTQDRIKKPSRDKSNDSDTTINNNHKEPVTKESPRVKAKESIKEKENNKNQSKEVRRSKSLNDKQKLSLVPKEREMSEEEKVDYDDIYGKPKKHMNFDDQFYDDDGDGLMLKTVNRKNILKQYNSSGTDSATESDVTSDDPYDCILVDDQKVKKNENHFPNVAELGKKLEKLSKTSKYSPNKNNIKRNMIQEKNDKNMRVERNNSQRQISPEMERDELIKYHEQRQQNSFKTFGIDNENGEKERVDERYYSNNHTKRNNEKNSPEKRRYPETNNKNNSRERRGGRPSYESIDSDVEQRNIDNRLANNRNSDKRESERKMRYYDSTNDELSDVGSPESRQLLPRSKLTKTNSNNSSQSKYEQDIGLMEYGETLQKRLKNPEYNSKYDEKSPHNGNMYGPWYDLWGLDSTGPIQRK